MSKIKKLAQLNKVITRLEDLGLHKEADSIHREFIKISQEGDARRILRMKIAQGMGYSADVPDSELLANIVRITDYIKPERLKNPSMGSSPRNVFTRDMAGATTDNSYAVEYWKGCTNSFYKVSSETMKQNFIKNVDALRAAARSSDMNTIMRIFSNSAG
jgi:hypothetical protein